MAAGVVLAAGEGSRFGGRKLEAELDGRAILEHVVVAARDAALDPILIVVGPESGVSGVSAVSTDVARPVVNPEPLRGLSSSLRIGIAALPDDVEVAVVLLGDQPLVTPAAIEALVAAAAAAPGYAAVPRYEDGSGPNPVALTRPLFALAEEASGDRGLGPLLADRPEMVIEVPVAGTNPDVDTRSDLELVREAAAGRIVPGR